MLFQVLYLRSSSQCLQKTSADHGPVEGKAGRWPGHRLGRGWTHEARAHSREARWAQVSGSAVGSASALLPAPLQNQPDSPTLC